MNEQEALKLLEKNGFIILSSEKDKSYSSYMIRNNDLNIFIKFKY